MIKPRLLVLARELPVFQEELKHSLSSLLDSMVSGVEVNGSIAAPYSFDSLLDLAVLGKGSILDQSMSSIQRGCELYVGIRTPETQYVGQRTEDGKFDVNQFGERGFDLAEQNDIPAILLDTYDPQAIYDFVQEQIE